MLELVIFWMACWGATTAITKLYVGRPVRRWVSGLSDTRFESEIGTPKESWWGFRASILGRLVRCPACTGFWVGLIFASLVALDVVFSLSSVVDAAVLGREVLFKGLGASAFCFAGGNWLEYLGAKSQQ